jgi:hypothetical protein
MLVGAFDPSAWAGLVFSSAPGRGFAFRFALECDGRRFDGYDFMDIVHEIGPCAPDGSYARLSFDPSRDGSTRSHTWQAGMILEWSKTDSNACIGRVQIKQPCVLEFRAYFPWDWSGSWVCAEDKSSTSDTCHLLRGINNPAHEQLSVTLHRTSAGRKIDPRPSANMENGECMVRFSMAIGDALHFFATMSSGAAGTGRTEWRQTDETEVTRLLADAEERYTATGVTVDRHWDGLGASITNNLHWMVALKPEDGTRYTPAGRRWIFPRHGGGRDHWTVFCWDAFFNALELAVESPELARATLWSVLDTQCENGNIPNWRGRYFGTPDRSQPPIGSFLALKLYLRTGDRSVLETAFSHLDRWSAWWRAPKGLRRDGNGNGLFEWGCYLDLLQESPAKWEDKASPHQFAAWESG